MLDLNLWRRGNEVSYTIKAMTIKDKASVIEMMRTFYASPAVLSNGSEEIFCNDIENCVRVAEYIDCVKRFNPNLYNEICEGSNT